MKSHQLSSDSRLLGFVRSDSSGRVTEFTHDRLPGIGPVEAGSDLLRLVEPWPVLHDALVNQREAALQLPGTPSGVQVKTVPVSDDMVLLFSDSSVTEAHLQRCRSMIRVASHDLRDPFSTFHNFKTLAEMKFGGAGKEMLDELSGIFRSAELLLNNLQVITADLFGRLVKVPEAIPLSEVFQRSLKKHSLMVRSKQLDILYDIPEDLMVYGDMQLLGQVLENLLFIFMEKADHRCSASCRASVTGAHAAVSMEMPEYVISESLRLQIEEDRWGLDPDDDAGITSVGAALAACVRILDLHGTSFDFETGGENTLMISFLLTIPSDGGIDES